MASSLSRFAGSSSFFPGWSGKRTSKVSRVASEAATAAVQPQAKYDYQGVALSKAVEFGVPAVLGTLSVVGSAGGVHLIGKVHDEKINKIVEKLDKQAEFLTAMDRKVDVGFCKVDKSFADQKGELKVLDTKLAGLDTTLMKMDKKLDAITEEQRQALRERR